ncbi:MAG: ABC transporter ATP-binding protein [Fimbriimonadaceae bacterium]|nr:ABC transporter ATP-binding protein [Chthonomonadaceae bacterium]MCO5297829.1 ABC transporter ATP-binding protein [Fimbriimonadaceae bacterium]
MSSAGVPGAPIIRTRNLSRTYGSGDLEVHALKDVSLTIEAGEFVAIMGPSGSGKSTFLNVVGCLDELSGGSYELDGIEVALLDDDELSHLRNRKIGFVFQTFNLLGRTSALDNVELPVYYAFGSRLNKREAAMRSLEMVGLSRRAWHKPNELSGGEQQRVAIARALINDPPLILADEPTGQLDSATGKEIMAIFRRLNEEGKTIIMVTHELDIAEHAKRIVHFRDGHLVEDEPVLERTPLA